MSLFDRFRKPAEKPTRCAKGRGCTYEIVGESHYQTALLSLTGGRKTENGVKLEKEFALKPEPNNRFDENAVAVLCEGKVVGHLRKEDAPSFKAFLRESQADIGLCNGKIVGGWKRSRDDEGSFGVKLSLSWPPKAAN